MPPRSNPAVGTAIVARLHKAYPGAGCSLDHRTPLELLVATILSAQCTDERVNKVTPALFARYRDARAYAEASPAILEEDIKSTGFYRAKTRSLIGLGTTLVERFGGKVPERMEDLVTLPGVGRKTANVLLGTVHDVPSIIVDTHVKRVAGRLGLTKNADPEKIEQDLWKVFPESDWTFASQSLILHGRQVCDARKPDCAACVLADLCPSRRLFMGGSRSPRNRRGTSPRPTSRRR
ncbi:MAG: endonuclease III [Acidobacteriota bacterium]